MKAPLQTCLLALVALSIDGGATPSSPVFEGYEAFYTSLKQPLFAVSEKREFLKGTAPSGNFREFWAGATSSTGPHHVVELDGADLLIDGRRLSAAGGRQFGTETPAALGRRAKLYLTENYVCIEGVAPTASGTAVRHVHVTLVTHPYTPAARRYELPGLFGSCLGLRHGEKKEEVRFYEASFHYPEGADQADGLTMQEFGLAADAFQETSGRLCITFVEPDNPYRFTAKPYCKSCR